MVKSLDFYFKHRTDGQSTSLAASISQATIDAVEREVGAIPVGNDSSGSGSGKTRGKCIKPTDKEKAIVEEYAAKHGIAAVLQYFKQKKHFPDVKEATMRGWKNLYLRELHIQSPDRKHDTPPVQIKVLPSKCRGRPLLLGEKK